MRSKKTFPHWLPIALVLLGAVLLRVPLLNGSFWLDEAAQVLESARPLSQQLAIREDFQPPLLHLLLHFSLYVSKTEWWLRTIGALIPGVITIYFTYKIGEKLKSRAAGLLSSILLATSSFHIFYSQELRPYSLPAAIGTVTWYLLINWWKTNQKFNFTKAVILGVLTAIGLYSSYLYPFLILSQVAWVFWVYKKSIGTVAISYAIGLLLFLPWLPFFFDQLSVGTTLQTSLPGWSAVVSHPQIKSLPLVGLKFVFGVQNIELSPFFIVALVTLAACAFLAFTKTKKTRLVINNVTPLLYWLLIPIISSWLISFWIPVLQPKRVLFSLPALYILIATLADVELLKVWSKKAWLSLYKYPSALLVLVVLALNIISTLSYWRQPLLQRENWKSLIQHIETKYPQRAVAVFAFDKPFAPWALYADPTYPTLATGKFLATDESALQTIKKATEYDFILVFDYLRDLTDPERKLDQLLIEYGYKEIEVIDYPLIGFVRIYSKPEAVISYK